MEELLDKALLFDYYSELLTETQRRIYEEVILEDYSESEIALDEKISRQGVHDMIKRTQKLLLDYEKKLGLVKKHKEKAALITDIETAIKKEDLTSVEKAVNALKEL